MLKSTYKPSAAVLAAALPPGWTEHKAPTGHTYYYHAESQTSTYTRPAPEPVAQPAPDASAWNSSPYANAPSLADPHVANAYLAQFKQPAQSQRGGRGGHGAGRGRGGDRGFEGRPKPQPIDKPRRKEVIPGCEPWILVYTKYSRRFVYNPTKNASYWRIPEKLMPGILELDKKRIRDKAAGDDDVEAEDNEQNEQKQDIKEPAPTTTEAQADDGHEYDSSEYEEVEVTDDEGNDAQDDQNEHPSKRQRTEDPAEEDGPVEFTEADIAAQLQAMGEDYGLDPGEYDDGNEQDWPEGAEGVEFSEEDAKFLFKDLLNDFGINPYSPWDKLLEEGKVVDDARYTALTTTRARKECWDEWSREKIAELKEQRAKQEKKDPRVAYMAFLQEKATPKLYWPEFKRKYKKEDAMKDLHLSDKDREKAYREHISRLKMPQAKLKSDLTALLKAQPTHLLHNKSTTPCALPTQVLVDPRFASVAPQIRDPLIAAFAQTLPPPPDDIDAAAAGDEEERRRARDARERRERALEERNRAVDEQKRRKERELAASKARLRDEERELEMAMRVGGRGLQSQFEEGRREREGDEGA